MDKTWQPSASDIAWQTNLILSMRDGGQWYTPGNGSVYTFEHSTKTMWLEEGPIDEMNWRIKTTVAATKLGWKVSRRDGADEKAVISDTILQSKSIFTGTAFNAARLSEKSDEAKQKAKDQFVEALASMWISPLEIGALDIRNGMVHGVFLIADKTPIAPGVQAWKKEHLHRFTLPVPYWR